VHPHLVQVTDVTDVISLSVLINVLIEHLLARDSFDESKGLYDGAAISPTPTKVIHLAATGGLDKGVDKPGHIEGMDIVANLFALVPIY